MAHPLWREAAHDYHQPCTDDCAWFVTRDNLCVCRDSGRVHRCDGHDCPDIIVTREARVCRLTGMSYPTKVFADPVVTWERVGYGAPDAKRRDPTQPVPKPMQDIPSPPSSSTPQQKKKKKKKKRVMRRTERLFDMRQWKINHELVMEHITRIVGSFPQSAQWVARWTHTCEVVWVFVSGGEMRITLHDTVLATLLWIATPPVGLQTLHPETHAPVVLIAHCATLREHIPTPSKLRARFNTTRAKCQLQKALRSITQHQQPGWARWVKARQRVAAFYDQRPTADQNTPLFALGTSNKAE